MGRSRNDGVDLLERLVDLLSDYPDSESGIDQSDLENILTAAAAQPVKDWADIENKLYIAHAAVSGFVRCGHPLRYLIAQIVDDIELLREE